MTPPVPPVLPLWERVLSDILDCTLGFPKVVRFTFSTRIDNLALDVLDHLVAARYAPRPRRAALLAEADADLARLRVLVRICHERLYLSSRAYEHISRGIDEAGRMIGGWRRQQEGA